MDKIRNIMNGREFFDDSFTTNPRLAVVPCKCGQTPTIHNCGDCVEISCPVCSQYVVRDNLADAVEEWNRRNL